MAGSESTGGSKDEQGTLISFPRSKWVPEDGIQPLDTENGNKAARDDDRPVVDEVDESIAQASRSLAIEATDFWASGDTQEFVGAAPSVNGSASESALDGGGRTARRAWRSVSLARLLPRPQLVALLAGVMVLAAGGTAAWQLLGGKPRPSKTATIARRSSLTYASASGDDTRRSSAVLAAHLRRPVLRAHSSPHPAKAAVHRVKSVHRAVTPAHAEAVSYRAPATTTSASNVTSSSSTYTPPAQTGSGPTQNSSSATTATASGDSGSGSTGQPARPGPNGFLTCISNCG